MESVTTGNGKQSYIMSKICGSTSATNQKKFSAVVHDYIDDILIAHSEEGQLLAAFAELQQALRKAGLVIAPEKVQRTEPYAYPGYCLGQQGFQAQKVEIRKDSLHILNDFQKLFGDINWIRSALKLSTGELKPLFDILKGDADPSSPRSLSAEGRNALHLVEQAISEQALTYCDYAKDWGLLILATPHAPTAVLYQEKPLRWLHLPVSPKRVLSPYYSLVAVLVAEGRQESIQLFGKERTYICVPYNLTQQQWLNRFSDD